MIAENYKFHKIYKGLINRQYALTRECFRLGTLQSGHDFSSQVYAFL